MAVRPAPPPVIDETDEALAARWRDGDEAALEELVLRYRRFARAKARTYFLVGADADDIEQEGLIGLCKAARDYRPDHSVTFRAFGELCVTRQLISAIKRATRHKHQPLNRYVSFSGAAGPDGRADPAAETIFDRHAVADIADEVISREELRLIRSTVAGALSAFEAEVLDLYVHGASYQEISLALGRGVKSIDNALQRIKRKLDAELRTAPVALVA